MYIVCAEDGGSMLYAGPNDSITLDKNRAQRFTYDEAIEVRARLEFSDPQEQSPWRVHKEDA